MNTIEKVRVRRSTSRRPKKLTTPSLGTPSKYWFFRCPEWICLMALILCLLHAWTNWMKNTKVCSLLFKELSWIGSHITRFAFIKIARSSAQWFNGLIRGEDEITCWTTRKKKGSAKPTCYHYDHSSAILKYHHSRDFFPPLPRRRILKLI